MPTLISAPMHLDVNLRLPLKIFDSRLARRTIRQVLQKLFRKTTTPSEPLARARNWFRRYRKSPFTRSAHGILLALRLGDSNHLFSCHACAFATFRIVLPTTNTGTLQSSHVTRYACVI